MNVQTHFNLLWTDVYLSHAPFVDKYLQQKYKKKKSAENVCMICSKLIKVSSWTDDNNQLYEHLSVI